MYKMSSHEAERIDPCFLSTAVVVLYTQAVNKIHTKQTYIFFCTFNPENQAL